MSRQSENLLIVAPGIPSCTYGIAEAHAWALYEACQRQSEIGRVMFVAVCATEQIASLNANGPNEYILKYHKGVDWDPFLADFAAFYASMKNLLESLCPKTVHIHLDKRMHIKIVEIIKALIPQARLYITLHDFSAICPVGGLVNHHSQYCPAPSLDACFRCRSREEKNSIWLHHDALRRMVDLIDGVFCPSKFMLATMARSGIGLQKMHYLENLLPPIHPFPSTPEHVQVNRFGFLGDTDSLQNLITILKGYSLLDAPTRQKTVLAIHIPPLAGMSIAPEIYILRDKIAKEGSLYWNESYHSKNCAEALSSFDWLLYPTAREESWPIQIQQATICKKPVVCPERHFLKENPAGIFFLRNNDPVVWGHNFRHLLENNQLWKEKSEEYVDQERELIMREYLRITGFSSMEFAWV